MGACSTIDGYDNPLIKHAVEMVTDNRMVWWRYDRSTGNRCSLGILTCVEPRYRIKRTLLPFSPYI